MGLKCDVKTPKGEVVFDSVTTTTTEKVVECLEVKDQSCAKLKVTFTKDTEHNVTNG